MLSEARIPADLLRKHGGKPGYEDIYEEFDHDDHDDGGKTGEELKAEGDRKSTRLNSSHALISYAVFCLKKNKHTIVHRC